MGAFGDDLLCCNKAEFYTRHQVVVKCLTTSVAAACVRATNEAQIDGCEVALVNGYYDNRVIIGYYGGFSVIN